MDAVAVAVGATAVAVVAVAVGVVVVVVVVVAVAVVGAVVVGIGIVTSAAARRRHATRTRDAGRGGPGRFPAGPLADALAARYGTPTAACRALGIGGQTMARWTAGGTVNWQTADRYAVAAGRHPAELWPNWTTTEDIAC